MSMVEVLKKRRERRKKSSRKKLSGTVEVPRLSVYKSNKYLYVQAIDDVKETTLASASSLKYGDGFKLNKKTAEKVGEDIAKVLIGKKIDKVVFDRNGFLYAGKIKALADSARKNGLKF